MSGEECELVHALSQALQVVDPRDWRALDFDYRFQRALCDVASVICGTVVALCVSEDSRVLKVFQRRFR